MGEEKYKVLENICRIDSTLSKEHANMLLESGWVLLDINKKILEDPIKASDLEIKYGYKEDQIKEVVMKKDYQTVYILGKLKAEK